MPSWLRSGSPGTESETSWHAGGAWGSAQRSGGNRRENLGCNAASTKASGEPTGSRSEAKTALLHCPTLRQGFLHTQITQWIQATQVRGFNLGDAVSPSQGQFLERNSTNKPHQLYFQHLERDIWKDKYLTLKEEVHPHSAHDILYISI